MQGEGSAQGSISSVGRGLVWSCGRVLVCVIVWSCGRVVVWSSEKAPYVYLHTRTTAYASVPPSHERKCMHMLSHLYAAFTRHAERLPQRRGLPSDQIRVARALITLWPRKTVCMYQCNMNIYTATSKIFTCTYNCRLFLHCLRVTSDPQTPQTLMRQFQEKSSLIASLK